MTSSGTYTFASTAASDLTLAAFARIGKRGSELTQQHLADASREANLLQVTLGARQPNLWRSEVFQISLTSGTAAYDLSTRMIAVQDVYLTTNSGQSFDRMLFPLALFEYDSQPNKTLQAPPTQYLIQKILPTPSITFWPVPDADSTYTANVRLLTQIQDASQPGGVTLDLPYVYLEVYVAGLSYAMARIYAKEQEMARKMDYKEAWDFAANTDTQDSVSLYISPDFSGYRR